MVRDRIDNEPTGAKTLTGIDGLDEALYGGLPFGRTTLILGTPGSGKTKLALQFLVNGLVRFGEPGLLVTFEESPAMLRTAAAALGLPGDSAASTGLHIIDGRPILDSMEGGSFDIGGLVAIVAEDIKVSGIRRVAFDGLDALFATSGTGEVTAREFRRLVELTDTAGVTSIVSVKPGAAGSDVPQCFALIEYAADAVLHIGYRLTEGLLQRIVRVVKIRNAGFAAGEHPFIISARGLDVSYSPALKRPSVISLERVSSGIEQLDEMLDGGLIRSSTTLISGMPGTAKSTLGAAFLAAGLKRGERCFLVALDEPAEQLVANVRSVGLELDSPAYGDALATLSLNPSAVIADEHYLRIERAVREHRPTLMVVDPISAFEKAGGRDVARLVVERLTALVKSTGIVAVFTAIASTQFGEVESTTGHVSSIADTWIHVSFAVKGGERNRTLTIVKSRGTAHSNQLREMILARDGITLKRVYQIQGEFLLGTARLEREQEHKRALEAHELEEKNLLRELAERKQDAIAKLRDAERELLEIDERMTSGREASASREAVTLHDRSEVSILRGGTSSHEV